MKQGKMYNMSASNRQSSVRISRNSAKLPIIFKKGWNRICLDLSDIVSHAFGINYASILELRIFASCRIWKVFLQDQDYSDDQLPERLQVLQQEETN